jgi:hypothetical protein
MRRVWALLAIVLIVAYAAAYRFTPRRYSYIGLDLEHARQFAHRWELFFYYPAGWAESMLIRAWPSLYNRYVECPQIVVLVVWDYPDGFNGRVYSFRFHSGPVPPPIDQIFPADTDVLEYVAKKNPGHGKTGNDGSWTTCKYYSCYLDRAEQFLSAKYPRPWTIEKVLAWYRESRDPEERKHLAYLLGTTSDPRAAMALGQSVEDEKLNTLDMFDARDTARRQLLNFIPRPKCEDEPAKYPVGLQGRGEGYEEEWFRDNKARLEKICANLPQSKE